MKKSSKKLVYVLSAHTSDTGHSLGVNSIAVDPTNTNHKSGTLYTAGRDGIIHSWGLNDVDVTSDYDTCSLNSATTTEQSAKKDHGKTVPLQKQQIHTNWVNDILLTNNYKSVASCSSDLTVKLWNPSTDDQTIIGQHRDYVKCLASPNNDQTSNWIVSGGLDRRIMGWDIGENRGQKFCIDSISDSNDAPKASVYALGANDEGLIVAGGPESVVRLYDSRTSKQVLKFVGHTDNIRSVLISKDGQWVLSGSSDATVKLWSVTASRLYHTFDMHDDSVWSLFSNHDNLDVFYSADRTGLVCKTDLRGCESKFDDVDDGVCSVVCNEHQGVSKIVATGGYIWTATSNSCIHRWENVDTGAYARQLTQRRAQTGKTSTRLSALIAKQQEQLVEHNENADTPPPPALDDSTSTPSSAASTTSSSGSLAVNFLRLDGGPSLDFMNEKEKQQAAQVIKIRYGPGGNDDYDNDNEDESEFDVSEEMAKIHVEPLQKNPIETLEGHIGLIKHRLLTDRRRVLTLDTAGEIRMWDLLQCNTLQTFGTGQDIDDLADELNALDTKTASISNWCQVSTRTGELYITLEEGTCFDAEVYADEQDGLTETFREDHRINIGRWVIKNLLNNLITTELQKDKEIRRAKKKALLMMQNENQSSASVSTVSTISSATDNNSKSTATNETSTAGDSAGIQKVTVPSTEQTDANAAANQAAQQPTKSKFMGRLRGFGKSKNKDKSSSSTSSSNYSNGSTAQHSTSSVNNQQQQPQQPQRPEMTMSELIDHLRQKASSTNSNAFTPPPAEDAPALGIPSTVKIMLCEQSANAGGTMDLYRGTVGQVGVDAELFEKVAPEWLGRLIFKNELPTKEGAKIGFTLQPFDDKVPPLNGGVGNLRLTAYQMLRARKVLIYLVEKLDSSVAGKYSTTDFEVLCQGRVITPEMTLASIRTKIWRSGGDVVLKYRFAK